MEDCTLPAAEQKAAEESLRVLQDQQRNVSWKNHTAMPVPWDYKVYHGDTHAAAHSSDVLPRPERLMFDFHRGKPCRSCEHASEIPSIFVLGGRDSTLSDLLTITDAVGVIRHVRIIHPLKLSHLESQPISQSAYTRLHIELQTLADRDSSEARSLLNSARKESLAALLEARNMLQDGRNFTTRKFGTIEWRHVPSRKRPHLTVTIGTGEVSVDTLNVSLMHVFRIRHPLTAPDIEKAAKLHGFGVLEIVYLGLSDLNAGFKRSSHKGKRRVDENLTRDESLGVLRRWLQNRRKRLSTSLEDPNVELDDLQKSSRRARQRMQGDPILKNTASEDVHGPYCARGGRLNGCDSKVTGLQHRAYNHGLNTHKDSKDTDPRTSSPAHTSIHHAATRPERSTVEDIQTTHQRMTDARSSAELRHKLSGAACRLCHDKSHRKNQRQTQKLDVRSRSVLDCSCAAEPSSLNNTKGTVVLADKVRSRQAGSNSKPEIQPEALELEANAKDVRNPGTSKNPKATTRHDPVKGDESQSRPKRINLTKQSIETCSETPNKLIADAQEPTNSTISNTTPITATDSPPLPNECATSLPAARSDLLSTFPTVSQIDNSVQETSVARSARHKALQRIPDRSRDRSSASDYSPPEDTELAITHSSSTKPHPADPLVARTISPALSGERASSTSLSPALLIGIGSPTLDAPVVEKSARV
ncbi:hypothetical protein LTR66_003964 [Elasticomyces elasticus]|nr:hypothetical protein LTR66_003964 [Elasticomyces elasticus]